MSSTPFSHRIRFDGNDDPHEIVSKFESDMLDYIREVAWKHNILPIGNDTSTAFQNLIVQLSEKKGSVVLLVDEYDFPLLEAMSFPKIQDSVRNIMKNIFTQVENEGDNIFFAFFTGISRFSNDGIFSGMNNLVDISTDQEYAAMFGYTEKEITKYFNDYIKNIAGADKSAQESLLKRMAEYYDGYTFDGRTHVYNPLTIERFFDGKGVFKKYWIHTGSRSFIEEFFHGKKIDWENLEGETVTPDAVMSPRDIGMASDPKMLLYQSGYMTIREIPGSNNFKLVFPNFEVRAAMAAIMMNNYFDSIEDADNAKANLTSAVVTKDYNAIINIFNNVLTSIYKSDKKAIEGADSKKKEDFFRGHLITLLQGADCFVLGEVQSNVGKADLVAKYKEKTLVIEIKYVDIKPKKVHDNIVSQYTIEEDCRGKLAQAISQLYEKNYFDAYANPLPLAIVIDESRDARISHAAFDKVAYRIDDKPPVFTSIGEIDSDGKRWKISWCSPISASKEPLSIVDGHLPASQSVKHETDLDDVTENLFLCQFVLPEKQYLAWKDSLQGPDSERIRDKVRKLKRTLASIQSASFWHSLPPEEKAKAFHDAVRTGVPVTLRYATPDGTFFLTALDIRAGEAIGLLVSTTRQFAYGPYPLSRLLNEDGRMLSSIQETPLEYVCEEQGIDTALPLPTPRQLLHWEDRK